MAIFHPFPRLSYEIRMQIWEMTVMPRTVHVAIELYSWHGNHADKDGKHAKQYQSYLVSSESTPAVLHTCREARNHGLYEKAFSEIPSPQRRGPQYVWLNWEIDIVDIGAKTDFQAYKPFAHLFHRLMFERDFADEMFDSFEAYELENFRNLKEIYVNCAGEGPINWLFCFDGGHWWPCGNKNMYFIDQKTGRVFRGEKGMDEVERLSNEEFGIVSEEQDQKLRS